MGGVADYFRNTLKLNGQGVDAIEKAESLIGAISGISGYISVAKTVLEALGILSQEDALQGAVNQILTGFKDALSAEDMSLKMVLVAQELGDARNAYDLLRSRAPDDAAAPADPGSLWGEDRGQVDSLSSGALVHLAMGDYWQRPFFDIQYQDPAWTGWWSEITGQSFAPPHNGFVFEYRVTLPAFLEAITIRLIVLAAIERNWRANDGDRQNMSDAADALEQYYNTIRDGIHEVLPPSLLEIEGQVPLFGPPNPPPPFGPPVAPPPNFPAWATLHAIFGAVEVYSTFNVLEGWPAGEWPISGPSLPADLANAYYDWFRVRHLVRTMARWKQVYIRLGLPGVASVLKQLRTLVGEPATLTGPHGDWSVQELVRRLQSYVQTDGTNLGLVGALGAVSLRNVLAKLQDAGLGAAAPTSFRAALSS